MKSKEMVAAKMPLNEAITQIAADFNTICAARKAVSPAQLVAPYKECFDKFQSYCRGMNIQPLNSMDDWIKAFPEAAKLSYPTWDAMLKVMSEQRAAALQERKELNQPVKKTEKPKVTSRIHSIVKAGGADLIVT